MQIFQFQLKNLPAFDIFDRLFQIALNYKFEGGEPSHLNSDPIKFEHFSLLLAWPGILALELATLTGRRDYKNQLTSLKNLLKQNAGYTEIRNFLDNLLDYTPVPEELINEERSAQKRGVPKKIASVKKKIREFQPELFKTLNLLFDQKFIVKEHSIYFELFKFVIGNYYIMCLMVAKHLSQDKKTYITSEDITAILNQCGIKNQPNIYYVSRFWYQELLKISNDAITAFNIICKKAKGAAIATTLIDIPSLPFSLEKLYFDENERFAFITEYHDTPKEFETKKSKGFAHKISPNSFSGYDLWCLSWNKNIAEQKNSNKSFLFISDKKHGADELENILYQLYQVALYSSGVMNSLITSWGDFIDDAENMIDSNLIGFKDWYLSIVKDYKTRDQLLKFKPVSRIIKSLENEFSEILKKAEIDHIPDDIREKVLKANEELKSFINLVSEQYPDSLEKRGSTKNLLILFDKYKEKCEYLKFLSHKQVDEDISFNTGQNYLRDTQRNLLPVIYEKLTGEKIKAGNLMRQLNLESPSAYNPYQF
jgi:hypothetical protein